MHSLAAVAVNPLCNSTDSTLTFEQTTRLLLSNPTPENIQLWLQTIPDDLFFEEMARRDRIVLIRRVGTAIAAVGGLLIASIVWLATARRRMMPEGGSVVFRNQFSALDRLVSHEAAWFDLCYTEDDQQFAVALKAAGGLRAVQLNAAAMLQYPASHNLRIEDGQQEWLAEVFLKITLLQLVRPFESMVRLLYRPLPHACALSIVRLRFLLETRLDIVISDSEGADDAK